MTMQLPLLLIAAIGPVVVDYVPAEPLAVVIRADPGFEHAGSLSELSRRVSEALEAKAWLRVELAESAQASCERGEGDPLYCQIEQVAKVSRESVGLLVVNAGRSGGQDYLRFTHLDLNRAREVLEGARSRMGEGEARDIAELEALAEMFAGVEQPVVRLEASDSIEQAVSGVLAGPLAEPFAGPLAHAELEVRGDVPLALSVDDATTLSVGGEGLRVRGLPVGSHRLRAAASGYLAQDRTIDLSAGEAGAVQFTMRTDHRGAWRASGWTGVGLGVLAAGVGAYGLAEAGSRPPGGRRMIRLLPTEVSAPTLEGEGAGPLVGGLAAALLTTGVAMAWTGLTADEPERPPWLEVALAVGAGIAVYAAFEGVEALR